MIPIHLIAKLASARSCNDLEMEVHSGACGPPSVKSETLNPVEARSSE